MLGAIIGDVVGSIYEFNNVRNKNFELFNGKNFFTDDSIMTLAVAEILQKRLYNDKDKIIDTFKRWGRAYPNRGYGGRFANWLFSENRESYRSYGNGAAMRVSPVGWYARNEQEVKELSKLVTEVTHSHPEGLKGAEVVAMCVYYARIGKSKEFIKQYVEQYYNLDFDYKDLNKNYCFNEICQDTVPQAIYCFLISKDFEDCLRTTISIGGDSDTLAAISCAIAEAYYKYIDNDLIIKIMDLLPKVIDDCDSYEVLNNFIEEKRSLLVYDEEINELTNVVGIIETYNTTTYINWIYSSSLHALAEYLIYEELDRIIGIDDDFPTKEYLKDRNLEAYINDLRLKRGLSYNTLLENLYKLLKTNDKEEFELILKEYDKLSEYNICYKYFDKPISALEYLKVSFDATSQIYRTIFEKRYKREYNEDKFTWNKIILKDN